MQIVVINTDETWAKDQRMVLLRNVLLLLSPMLSDFELWWETTVVEEEKASWAVMANFGQELSKLAYGCIK